jgi:hypothetical protein
MQRLAFDRARPDRAIGIDAALATIDAPPDRRMQEALTRANTEDLAFWGPRDDPGGDPVQLVETPQGPAVILAGRRIPCRIDGDVVSLGIPARIGYCVHWAVKTADVLTRKGYPVVVVFGRGYGLSGQTWVEYQADGRDLVADWTLSPKSFDREAYYSALHASVGTRLEIPDRETFARLRQAIDAGAWDGPRDEFIKRVTAPGSRQ